MLHSVTETEKKKPTVRKLPRHVPEEALMGLLQAEVKTVQKLRERRGSPKEWRREALNRERVNMRERQRVQLILGAALVQTLF